MDSERKILEKSLADFHAWNAPNTLKPKKGFRPLARAEL